VRTLICGRQGAERSLSKHVTGSVHESGVHTRALSVFMCEVVFAVHARLLTCLLLLRVVCLFERFLVLALNLFDCNPAALESVCQSVPEVECPLPGGWYKTHADEYYLSPTHLTAFPLNEHTIYSRAHAFAMKAAYTAGRSLNLHEMRVRLTR
jgi:hypothetical protein